MLLWTGLVFIVALDPFLKIFGVSGSEVLIAVGAVLMVIGCVLMWFRK